MIKKQQEKNRKLVFGLVALFAAVAVIVGVGYAFFSDTITGDGTAQAGTLDITGTIADATNTNWNPGDKIPAGVTGTCAGGTGAAIGATDANTCTTNGGTWTDAVTNAGTKSAWIRQVLTVSTLTNTPNTSAGTETTGDLSGWVYACVGNATQADMITAFKAAARTGTPPIAPDQYYGQITAATVTVGSMTCTKLTTSMLPYTVAPASLSAPTDVISGSAEADGNATTWSPAGTSAISLFFDPYAPNASQLGSIDYTVAIQALQYRNNTTDPTTNNGWQTVTTAEFTL